MKKIILWACWFVSLTACAQADHSYSIKGKIGNYNEPAIIYLQYLKDNEVVTQSSPLKNGQFAFSGEIDNPANGRMVILPQGGTVSNNRQYTESITLMLSDEKIEVNSPDLLQNAVITGSKINDDQQRLIAALALVNEKIDLLVQEFESAPAESANNKEFVTDVQSRYNALQDEMMDTYVSFIRNNPDSYISLMAVMELSQQPDKANLILGLLKSLSPEIQNTGEGKNLAQRMDAVKLTAIGSVAPDFTLNDPMGKPVHLSDFRGKYLLIDFWASWCGPCRKENPNVVRAYQAYKSKNFEILGVSLDNKNAKQAWLNAIEKDKLTWPQVSDLNGWQNAVAIQYNIMTIPQNILLDPAGVIVAKNLRGEALPAKLSELLD
jgi:peroxiredoxin